MRQCFLAAACVMLLTANAGAQTDLTGVWNGATVNGPHIKSDDPLVTNLPARDGTLLNFERDGTLIRRANPNKPIYKPEYWEKIQKLDQNGNEADPSYGCMPGGVPRIGPPAQIVQTPKQLVFLYVSPPAQGWGDPYRVIPTDGRKHTPLQDLDGTWKGESIGHWEGDTLVVDTIGFNDRTFVDNYRTPHTAQMHVVERFHFINDGKVLEDEISVDDPGAFNMPWKAIQRWNRTNRGPMEELSCSENNENLFNYDVKPIPQAARPDF